MRPSREVEAAWTRHGILVFRDMRMTPEEHIAFTRRFGPLHIMEPLQYNLPGHPEIFVVSNVEEDGKALGMKRAGWGWHTDGEDKAIPNAGSMLYALELPPEGGDTLFADMYAAYEGFRQRNEKTHLWTKGLLQPHQAAPRALPSPARAHRGRQGQAARRVASAGAAPPEVRPHRALHRALGLRHRRHAGEGRRRSWCDTCRSSRCARSSSTATAGACTTPCSGTTAARSTARRRSTTRSTAATCCARPSKATCR